MGYPLRWDTIATPQGEDENRQQVDKREAGVPRSLRRFFLRVTLLTLAGSALLILLVIGLSSFFLSDSRPTPLRSDTASASAPLLAGPLKIVRHAGYVVVTGRFVNHSIASLNNVEAMVDLLDGNGSIVGTQSAMLERESIPAGQATGFQVDMPDVSRAKAYRLHFQRLYGSDIN